MIKIKWGVVKCPVTEDYYSLHIIEQPRSFTSWTSSNNIELNSIDFPEWRNYTQPRRLFLRGLSERRSNEPAIVETIQELLDINATIWEYNILHFQSNGGDA